VAGPLLMLIVAVLLMMAWRVAGYLGLDRWVLPAMGVPGYPGTLSRGVGGTGRQPQVQ
jgi:thiosulfate dehydrogenase (quinone) large subunit